MIDQLQKPDVQSLLVNRIYQKLQNQDTADLKRAAEKFEAVFAHLLFASLRKSMIPSGFFGEGLQGEIFQAMMEERVSEAVARRRQLGIADLIEKQLRQQVNQVPASRESVIPLSQRKRLVERARQATGLPAELIYAVIQQESAWNPNAVSSKGAKGLMQLMDETARELGVRNVFDPLENVLAGSRYLKKLFDEFDDMTLALAAYNAGPGAVRKYGNQIPPYRETQEYVKKVMRLWNK